VDEKENEIIVIPKLLDQLDLDGALVSSTPSPAIRPSLRRSWRRAPIICCR